MTEAAKSSGNVFADLGFDDPEGELRRADERRVLEDELAVLESAPGHMAAERRRRIIDRMAEIKAGRG